VFAYKNVGELCTYFKKESTFYLVLNYNVGVIFSVKCVEQGAISMKDLRENLKLRENSTLNNNKIREHNKLTVYINCLKKQGKNKHKGNLRKIHFSWVFTLGAL